MGFDSRNWSLCASDGRLIFGGEFNGNIFTLNKSLAISSRIFLNGKWPDRSKEIDFFNPPADFNIELYQFILDIGKIHSLITNMSKWIENAEPFKLDISAEPLSQQLVMEIATPTSTILRKGLLAISIKNELIEDILFKMPLDPSCIEAFILEIRSALGN